MSASFHTYQAELFPTRIRARAVGFVYSWSRLSGVFTSLMIGFFLRDFGVPGSLHVHRRVHAGRGFIDRDIRPAHAQPGARSHLPLNRMSGKRHLPAKPRPWKRSMERKPAGFPSSMFRGFPMWKILRNENHGAAPSSQRRSARAAANQRATARQTSILRGRVDHAKRQASAPATRHQALRPKRRSRSSAVAAPQINAEIMNPFPSRITVRMVSPTSPVNNPTLDPTAPSAVTSSPTKTRSTAIPKPPPPRRDAPASPEKPEKSLQDRYKQGSAQSPPPVSTPR